MGSKIFDAPTTEAHHFMQRRCRRSLTHGYLCHTMLPTPILTSLRQFSLISGKHKWSSLLCNVEGLVFLQWFPTCVWIILFISPDQMRHSRRHWEICCAWTVFTTHKFLEWQCSTIPCITVCMRTVFYSMRIFMLQSSMLYGYKWLTADTLLIPIFWSVARLTKFQVRGWHSLSFKLTSPDCSLCILWC